MEKCISALQNMGTVYQISWKKMGAGEKVYQNLCVILLRVNMAKDSSA